MARPFKDGLEYFPLDTTFFMDDKIRLLKSEFGIAGIIVYVYLLCEIYRDEGYYKNLNDDVAMLMAESLGNEVSYKLIKEIIACCIKRKLFSAEASQCEKGKICLI